MEQDFSFKLNVKYLKALLLATSKNARLYYYESVVLNFTYNRYESTDGNNLMVIEDKALTGYSTSDGDDRIFIPYDVVRVVVTSAEQRKLSHVVLSVVGDVFHLGGVAFTGAAGEYQGFPDLTPFVGKYLNKEDYYTTTHDPETTPQIDDNANLRLDLKYLNTWARVQKILGKKIAVFDPLVVNEKYTAMGFYLWDTQDNVQVKTAYVLYVVDRYTGVHV